ncbi:hypothetical protein RclHR1_07890017 [Rhizophagus clarus]|uniref:Uncharacterized protein n=1 Tax=Rhizophagus clarus TaxID=94130 RepID=A0A2Z6SDG6_9GLOM|nr:hypothetical protein RclHR1_07890017 [Rhizophagus clarus]
MHFFPNTLGVTRCVLKETGFLGGKLPHVPCFELAFVDIQDYPSQFQIIIISLSVFYIQSKRDYLQCILTLESDNDSIIKGLDDSDPPNYFIALKLEIFTMKNSCKSSLI